MSQMEKTIEGEHKSPIARNREQTWVNSERIAPQQAFATCPLPAPSVLKDYEDILPGVTNRILARAERISQHRQRLELLSLLLAFATVLATLATAAYAAHSGKPLVEGIFAVIATAISPFIYRQGVKRGRNLLMRGREK
jgi:uncharacterized membrane protein